jgi:hypothetical protein
MRFNKIESGKEKGEETISKKLLGMKRISIFSSMKKKRF